MHKELSVKSRVRGDSHARFGERVGVARPRSTRPDDSFSNAKVIHSDGSCTDLRLIDSEATGDTDAVYDLLGRKRDAQTKGLVIKNGIKVLK